MKRRHFHHFHQRRHFHQQLIGARKDMKLNSQCMHLDYYNLDLEAHFRRDENAVALRGAGKRSLGRSG